MNGDAAAVMNGDAIDVTVVPDEDDMVQVDANPPMMVETGDSVWPAEATWLVFLLNPWRLHCGLVLILFLLLIPGD
jgi:hypothetical protein